MSAGEPDSPLRGKVRENWGFRGGIADVGE
jgi:hypothetical protein